MDECSPIARTFHLSDNANRSLRGMSLLFAIVIKSTNVDVDDIDHSL